MLKLLHIGLGPLGKFIVSDLARRGIGRVVEAVDIDPSLKGKKLSEVVPECGFDCPVYSSIPEAAKASMQGFDAAVLATSSDLAKCMPSLRELLALGLPVVSTCEELLYPWLRHAAHAAELETLCQKHGGRVLGTGVNPGFMMDTLPVAATAVCRAVKKVHIWRIQDATTRRIPFQQKIGAGLDDAAFAAKINEGSLRHVGLGESLHFVSHYLGLNVDKWTETIEPVKADRDLTCGLGPIPKGRAAGVRQVAKGWASKNPLPEVGGGGGRGWVGSSQIAPADAVTLGDPVITMEFQAAIAQTDPHDRVQIDAEPPIDLVIKNGVHGDIATSAITLNAIPSLIAAKPGVHTMATVPMVHFVAK